MFCYCVRLFCPDHWKVQKYWYADKMYHLFVLCIIPLNIFCNKRNKSHWQIYCWYSLWFCIQHHLFHKIYCPSLGTDHLTCRGGGGYGGVFFGQHELEYLFILSPKARIFFTEFNIRWYDKNSVSDYYFFFLH